MGVQVADMQTLPSFILLHLIVLLLQKFPLASVIAVLQLGLPDHFEFDSFLDVLAPRPD